MPLKLTCRITSRPEFNPPPQKLAALRRAMNIRPRGAGISPQPANDNADAAQQDVR